MPKAFIKTDYSL